MDTQLKPTIGATLQQQEWDFGNTVLKLRFAEALQQGASRYPVFRSTQFAARRPLDELFDDLALELGLNAQRMDASSLILDGEGLFATARGYRKNDYCSCNVNIWADSLLRLKRTQEAVMKLVGETRITEPMFTIDWHFLTGRGELQDATIEELANDRLYDEAYPYLTQGVQSFIDSYLASTDTVLVLQGNPGTGKTRLVRAILGALSRRKGGHAAVLYTGDKKTMESDEIFVKFITGWHDAFVVEDADHLLRPRAEGNENLHRFLSIADGVVRSQGRKIIFSTNLPNVHDLDDALVRPGRCFAHILTRSLNAKEAERLFSVLKSDDKESDSVRAGLGASPRTLAEIYRAVSERA